MLLGRKAMANVHSVLKNRDITLLTKVHLVKAMVFSVVMYGCESWTIKNVEHQRIDALNHGVGEDSWNSEEIKPINPKGSQHWIFIERTDAEAELPYFGHLKQRAD